MLKNSDSKNKNWISEELACNLLEIKSDTLRRKCRNAEYTYKMQKSGNKNIYFISVKSLPKRIQNKLNNEQKEEKGKSYSNSPIWAKFQADKYISVIKAAGDKKGIELKRFIVDWNIENPEYRTSYSCLLSMKRRYKENGIDGLLAQYGKTQTIAPISDEHYEYFKNLYLVEGSPSLQSCWDSTLGYAMRNDGINKSNFPSRMAFLRKLQREVPKQSIYLARNGQSAWNRKFGSYIERDYRNIICGKVWVSDHAQIDVACILTQ